MQSVRNAVILGVLLVAGPLAGQQPPSPLPPPPPAPQAGPMGFGMMRGWPGRFGPGLGAGLYAPRWLIASRQALGLTPEQVSRLETLAQETRQASDKAAAEARSHWDQLAELFKQPAPDVNQVRSHAQAALQAMQAAGLAHLTAAAQAKALLTAEQRGKVEGWAQARRMGMMDRARHGGRGWMHGRFPGRFRGHGFWR